MLRRIWRRDVWLARPTQCPRLGGMSPAELGLLPDIGWDSGIAAQWRPTGPPPRPGSMNSSLSTDVRDYPQGRDQPGRERVSRLSPPALRPARPREVVAACHTGRHSAAGFLRELGWRGRPSPVVSLSAYHWGANGCAFEAFAWRDDGAQLTAWRRGRTGVPLVDAGMRQLWAVAGCTTACAWWWPRS